MARRCSCCGHPDAAALDGALIAGAAIRDVAGHFSVSASAVDRHSRDHLPARIAASRALLAAVDRRDGARRLATMTRGEFILQALGRLEAAHDQAVADGDVRARIAAVDAQLRALHRLGVVGPEHQAGIVTPLAVQDRAEQQADMLKDMATEFLSLTTTIRARMSETVDISANADQN